MKAAWIIGALVLTLAGCGPRAMQTITYEGEIFAGNLRPDRDDRASFVATGGPASVSLEGAKRAAAFQVVRHCIDFLGTSDVVWTNGPDVEDTALVIQDDDVVLTGRCAEP